MGSFQHEPLLVLPMAGLASLVHLPDLWQSFHAISRGLAAMGSCQIAQSCQTGLQTHLASRKQSREHKLRASGHVPPRVLGRYRHKGGAPCQYPAPLHSPARTHCCAGHRSGRPASAWTPRRRALSWALRRL